MKFRNYCIVVMGDTKDVLVEVTKVAETKPNYLDAKGILIATFSSAAAPNELTDYFRLNNRSFLLFDLSKDNSGYHITKKPIHEGLFGFLDMIGDSELRSKSEEFIKEVTFSSDTKNDMSNVQKTQEHRKEVTPSPIGKKITDADINKMSKKEKDELLNIILEKGVNNLTENDKDLAQKLAI